jgi:epoxyqueuosine reductase QueG
VIGALASDLGARALFPFGGPPWQPFTRWARRSGAAWESPVGLLVHARMGLFVSYRGALAFAARLALPAPPELPCDGCARPCFSACPAGALTGDGYDVSPCHGWLDTAAGGDCVARGCAVRRACPVGRGLRPEAQSAFHMAAFHGRH